MEYSRCMVVSVEQTTNRQGLGPGPADTGLEHRDQRVIIVGGG